MLEVNRHSHNRQQIYYSISNARDQLWKSFLVYKIQFKLSTPDSNWEVAANPLPSPSIWRLLPSPKNCWVLPSKRQRERFQLSEEHLLPLALTDETSASHVGPLASNLHHKGWSASFYNHIVADTHRHKLLSTHIFWISGQVLKETIDQFVAVVKINWLARSISVYKCTVG